MTLAAIEHPNETDRGNEEFAKLIGLPLHRGGFYVPLRVNGYRVVKRVVVKTSRLARYLMIDTQEPPEDIYVLAAYNAEEDRVVILCWQWREKVEKFLKRWPMGDLQYVVPRQNMRPISELLARRAAS